MGVDIKQTKTLPSVVSVWMPTCMVRYHLELALEINTNPPLNLKHGCYLGDKSPSLRGHVPIPPPLPPRLRRSPNTNLNPSLSLPPWKKKGLAKHGYRLEALLLPPARPRSGGRRPLAWCRCPPRTVAEDGTQSPIKWHWRRRKFKSNLLHPTRGARGAESRMCYACIYELSPSRHPSPTSSVKIRGGWCALTAQIQISKYKKKPEQNPKKGETHVRNEITKCFQKNPEVDTGVKKKLTMRTNQWPSQCQHRLQPGDQWTVLLRRGAPLGPQRHRSTYTSNQTPRPTLWSHVLDKGHPVGGWVVVFF